jgi:hypothetical protein
MDLLGTYPSPHRSLHGQYHSGVEILPNSVEAQQPWYQAYARTLMDASIYSPIVPIAVAGENVSMVREFWPWETWKGGARDAKAAVGSFEGFFGFDAMCHEWH